MKRFLCICTSLAVLACGGSDSTAPASVTGSYSLQSINGASLPTSIVIATGDTLTISSGSLVVNPDHTFTTIVSEREDDNGTVTTDATPASGTWSINSNVVTFADPADPTSTLTATASGNTLTVNDFGFIEVFVKQ